MWRHSCAHRGNNSSAQPGLKPRTQLYTAVQFSRGCGQRKAKLPSRLRSEQLPGPAPHRFPKFPRYSGSQIFSYSSAAHLGATVPPRDMWRCLKASLVATLKGGCGRGQGASQPPPGPRAAPTVRPGYTGRPVTHTQPTPHAAQGAPWVLAGEAPKAKTLACTAESPRGPRPLGGPLHMYFIGRVCFLHEAHVFFRVKSCRVPRAAWPAGRASSAPVLLGVFSLRFQLLLRLGCISPVPGIASDSWAGAEAGPQRTGLSMAPAGSLAQSRPSATQLDTSSPQSAGLPVPGYLH